MNGKNNKTDKNTVGFDFIDSAVKGYKFFWREKAVIFAAAAVPLLIKLTSFLGLKFFNLDENFLRQGLFLVPSFFAEGWLVARLIRLAIFGEHPLGLNAEKKGEEKALPLNARSILAATLMYVLTKLSVSLFSGLVVMGQAAPVPAAEPADPQIFTIVVASLALALTIWAFRFLWLYVPAAMDLGVEDFLKRIKPFRSSIYMIGTWLLCFVPLAMVLVLISEMVMTAFPGTEDTPSAAYTYIIVLAQGTAEMVISIVSSVAMAYGIQSLYQGKNPPRTFFGL